jgi:hypothetical protein
VKDLTRNLFFWLILLSIGRIGFARDFTKVVHVTDTEGDDVRFQDFLKNNPAVSLDGSGEIVIKTGYHFIFGGDVSDQGAYSLDHLELLVRAKKRYPERVTLIAGNRDTNKIRITKELLDENAWKKRLQKAASDGIKPYTSAIDNQVNRLKWILSETMWSPRAFEYRREELQRRLRTNISDESVVKSYLADNEVGGALLEYLKHAQLADVIDSTVYFHGASTRDSVGLVPGKGFIPKARDFVKQLNEWYTEQINSFIDNKTADALIAYQEPHISSRLTNHASTIYGRHSDEAGNTHLPSQSTRDYYLEDGIEREVVGHTPQGGTGTGVRTKNSNFEVFIADSSNPKSKGAVITIVEGPLLSSTVKLDDGEVLVYETRMKEASFLGISTEDGFLITGRQKNRGHYVGKRYSGRFVLETREFSSETLNKTHLIPRDYYDEARESFFRGKNYGLSREEAQAIRAIEFATGWELIEFRNQQRKTYIFKNRTTGKLIKTSNIQKDRRLFTFFRECSSELRHLKKNGVD